MTYQPLEAFYRWLFRLVQLSYTIISNNIFQIGLEKHEQSIDGRLTELSTHPIEMRDNILYLAKSWQKLVFYASCVELIRFWPVA